MFPTKVPTLVHTCVAISIILSVPVSARAAEFKWSNWDADWLTGTLRLDGEIKPGDHKKLLTALGDRFGYGKGSFLYLDLNSKGGNFDEALKIAEVSREKNLSTMISAGNECLSACAIIFMSGWSNNNTFFYKSRTMHPTSVLGFHAPIVEAVGGNFDAADLDDAHSRAIEQVGKRLMSVAKQRVQSWTAPLIKPGLINEMMLVRGRDNFYFIDTVGKAAEYEIQLHEDTLGTSNLNSQNLLNACWNALAEVADSAVANDTWLDSFGRIEFEQRIDSETGRRIHSIGSIEYKQPFCEIALSDASDVYAVGASVTVGVGGAGQTVEAPSWFFWDRERKLSSLPTK